jgi:hypothetical protein
MPFVQQQTHLFNRSDVESLTPGQIGVYGIYRQNSWIYIGKGDIRQRLLAHLNGDNAAILECRPTHWVGEVTKNDPSVREKELIAECLPICNQRIG